MRPLRRRRPPTRSKLACAALLPFLSRHFFLQRMRDRSISDNHTRSNDAHVARRCNIDTSTHSKPSIVNTPDSHLWTKVPWMRDFEPLVPHAHLKM